MRAVRHIAFLTFVALGGCARDGGDFPSLAPRPVERLSFDEPAAAPASPVAKDAALDARIAEVVRTIAAAQTAFDAALARAEIRTRAARGAAAGSDAWLDAQTALGELDVARADASEPVSTLEQLSADRGVAGLPGYPDLQAALADARARLEAMTGAVARLQSALRG